MGLGGFFVNLTADFHHSSVYLVICAICCSHSKKGNNFLRVQIPTKRHLTNKYHCITHDYYEDAHTTLQYSKSVSPTPPRKVHSHGDILVLENYQCSFNFIIEEANKNQHSSVPTKVPFQPLQLSATQMFYITVLMVFYVLWTIFSVLLLQDMRQIFLIKYKTPISSMIVDLTPTPHCLYYGEVTDFK